MLISYNLLKNFFEKGVLDNIPANEIAEILARQGLEIAGIKYLGNDFENIVIAEVLEKEKHPNADKLSLCKVSDGKNEYQIICGAKNFEKGAKVVLSKIDAVLPGNFKIEKAKIRGLESFGMLCSEKELGFAKESEGIWVLPDDARIGENLSAYIGFDDEIFELEITPNRGDCLSVLGVAREISAALNLKLKMPKIFNLEGRENLTNSEQKICIELKNDSGCESYSAILATKIDNFVKSPNWLKFALIKCGFRPINFLVDITNYILLELGQPMHVFDFDKLASFNENEKKIIIRHATKDEKILALNNLEYALDENDLVIADEKNAIAIAGVIGGLNSCADETTKTAVFESAVFSQQTVRKTSRKLNVSTDSSYRFERGVSDEIKNFALQRAADILLAVLPNAVLSKKINENQNDSEKANRNILLRLEEIKKVLGKEYEKREILDFLERLNFGVTENPDGNLNVVIPDYRNDIFLEIDLIEEIARLDNYNNIEPLPILISPNIETQNNTWNLIKNIKDFFVKIGFFEAENYPFVSKKKLDAFNLKENEDSRYFKILNPLSEYDEYLINGRLPRLIDNAVYNSNRNQDSIKLFEIGKTFEKITSFSKDLEENENIKLSVVAMGNCEEIYWNNKNANKIDFYYLKGVFGSFLENYGLQELVSFKNIDSDFIKQNAFDKQQSMEIFLNHESIGFLGKLSKNTEKFFGSKKEMFAFEINLNKMFEEIQKKSKKIFTQISCFQTAERDLSLIVSNEIKYENIEKTIKNIANEFLTDLKVVDIYDGDQIQKDCKNISVRFYLQSKKETLSDETINFLQNRILEELDKNFGVKLRVL